MWQLYVIGFSAGILTVFFEVAYQSILPELVDRDRLAEGNSRLEISRSAAQILGPGLGGFLVGVITAPMAILADALSYLGSASFLFGIRTRDTPAPSEGAAPPRPSLRHDGVVDGRQGSRTGRLEDLLHPLEGEPQTPEDRGVIQQHDPVDIAAAHGERQRAGEWSAEAIGDGDGLDRDGRARRHRPGHRVRANRLHAVDPDGRPLLLDRSSDTLRSVLRHRPRRRPRRHRADRRGSRARPSHGRQSPPGPRTGGRT